MINVGDVYRFSATMWLITRIYKQDTHHCTHDRIALNTTTVAAAGTVRLEERWESIEDIDKHKLFNLFDLTRDME